MHNSLLPIPMHSTLAPVTVPSVSRPDWLVLSVHLSPSALDVFERHHPLRLNSVLGSQDVRDRTVNPQAPGFNGGNRKCHLLFKSKGACEQVKVHLQSQIGDIRMETLTPTAYAPLGFKTLGDLGYVNELFCWALPDPLMAQLLQVAPLMEASRNEPTLDEQAQHWTHMYTIQLFQYDQYPPTMLVMHDTRCNVTMMNMKFSLDILDRICLQQPQDFTDEELEHLLCFQLMLHCLARFCMAFSQYLYPCHNPIYGKVTQYIATEVKHLAVQNTEGCLVEDEWGAHVRGHLLSLAFKSISLHEGKQQQVVMKLKLGRDRPKNSPMADDLNHHCQEQA